MRKQAFKQVYENNGLEAAREALGKSIARWTDKNNRLTTAIPGLSLFRYDEPNELHSGMYEPSICMVAQGAKRVMLGDDTYVSTPSISWSPQCIFPLLCRLSKQVKRNLTWGSC